MNIWEGSGVNKQTKALFGSWVQAIGTFIAAVGSTPSSIFTKEQLLDLTLIGNTMQAVGNAVLADTMEIVNLGKIGNELQAIGNSTVVSGILLDFSDTEKEKLYIKGNLIQALGAFTATGNGFDKGNERIEALFYIANVLQGIGNSLQALGGAEKLKFADSKSGELLEFLGSWIQTIGAFIVAIEDTKEWVLDDREKISNFA